MSNESTTTPPPDVIADHLDELKQFELAGYELAVKKARNALFWTAGLIFFWEMYGMYQLFKAIEPTTFVIALIISGIFVALAFWTKKKPYTALVSGIAAFILYILLAVVLNGLADGAEGVAKALISGVIIKIVIFIALVKPLKEAKELQQAKEQII
jgi:preprotein translocase subunit Sec61beta